jgi:hypothetical protein
MRGKYAETTSQHYKMLQNDDILSLVSKAEVSVKFLLTINGHFGYLI